MKGLLRVGTIVLIAVGVIVGVFVGMRPAPVMVDIAAVDRGPMRVTVDEDGKTRIRERYVISSPLTGRLRRITLDPGDEVVAMTTPVAVIEPTSPELLDPRALAEAEARVRAAEAAVQRAGSVRQQAVVEYNLAETELGRVREAAEAAGMNQQEVDTAEAAERTAAEVLRTASYSEEIARFELDLAESALLYARGETPANDGSRMVLTSPIDGVVLHVFRESVTVIDPGESLIEVGDPRDLEVVIDVLSTDGVRIAPGDDIIIEHWGGDQPLAATVRLVEPAAFKHVSALGISEQRVNVIADFASPPSARPTLGDQYRVEARIVTWQSDRVMRCPASAAFRVGDAWSVYVVEGRRAKRQTIDIGQRNGQTVEVLSGLSEGDRVVMHPSDQLSEGVRVRERRRAPE